MQLHGRNHILFHTAALMRRRGDFGRDRFIIIEATSKSRDQLGICIDIGGRMTRMVMCRLVGMQNNAGRRSCRGDARESAGEVACSAFKCELVCSQRVCTH